MGERERMEGEREGKESRINWVEWKERERRRGVGEGGVKCVRERGRVEG